MDRTTDGQVVVAAKVDVAAIARGESKPKPYEPAGKPRIDSRSLEEIEADLKREWLAAASEEA